MEGRKDESKKKKKKISTYGELLHFTFYKNIAPRFSQCSEHQINFEGETKGKMKVYKSVLNTRINKETSNLN